MNVLICNVGNRDVSVEQPEGLPKTARALGERLIAAWPSFKERLTLPILGPAVEHVPDLAAVILVASDQPDQPDAPAAYAALRDKDTCLLAEAAKRQLETLKKLAQRPVTVRTVHGNPADYDVMLAFYERELPRLALKYPDAATRFYVGLSGGTQAMNAMLLLAAANLWGARCVPLYVSESSPLPLELRAAQSLSRRQILEAVGQVTRAWSYAGALALCQAHQPNLDVDAAGYALLTGLLRYGHSRLVFDFDAAAKSLQTAAGHGPLAHRPTLQNWLAALQTRDPLVELVFSAEVAYWSGNYSGFLAQVFQFVEDGYGEAIARLGARFTDESRRNLESAWLDETPGLREHLAQKKVDVSRGVNRYVAEQILDFLSAAQPAAQALQAALQPWQRLAGLRNRVLHAGGSASQAAIAEAWGQDTEILPALRQTCAQLTGRPTPENPFVKLNDLISEHLAELAKAPAYDR